MSAEHIVDWREMHFASKVGTCHCLAVMLILPPMKMLCASELFRVILLLPVHPIYGSNNDDGNWCGGGGGCVDGCSCGGCGCGGCDSCGRCGFGGCGCCGCCGCGGCGCCGCGGFGGGGYWWLWLLVVVVVVVIYGIVMVIVDILVLLWAMLMSVVWRS